jgi:hypothetical protein
VHRKFVSTHDDLVKCVANLYIFQPRQPNWELVTVFFASVFAPLTVVFAR